MEKELKLMKIENERSGSLSLKRKIECSFEINYNVSTHEAECICNLIVLEAGNEQNRLKICIIHKLNNCTDDDVLFLKAGSENPSLLFEKLEIMSLIEKAVDTTERAILY